MKSSFFVMILILLVALVAPFDLDAQCAMCKGAAEANLRQGGGDPKGLNNGILYMLSIPYLLVGGIGYWWWRNRRQEKEQVTELTEEDFERYE